MQYFLRTTIATIICFFLSSCINLPSSYSQIKPETKAFVKIYRNVSVEECLDDKCPKKDWISSGSGLSIFVSKDMTTILTAGHICEVEKSRIAKNIKKIKTVITIVNFKGESHIAKIIKTNIGNSEKGGPDLCLLSLRDDLNLMPKVKFSLRSPKIGEKIYTMAAPAGIYHPPIVPIFSGVFSGDISETSSLITVPSAGGASGAVVLNSRNQAIGVIYAMSTVFHGITLSTNYKSTLNFLTSCRKEIKAKKNMSLPQ